MEQMTTDEMELEDKPAREIDLQTVHVEHIQTDICNIPETSNIKQEPAFRRNVDVAKFSEYSKYSGNVANIIDIKTEVIGSDDYYSGNLNNTHGPTHSNHTIGDQLQGTTAITPEPEKEKDESNVTNKFVIEIDTCKDEYYEQYGYPTNCVNANLHNSEQNDGRTLCAIDTEPYTVGLRGIRNTNHDITQRVQIHEPGSTRVIDGSLEASVTDLTRNTESIKTNKTHVCTVCGAAVRGKSNLNRHILIHTGVKPYKCPVCAVRFTEKGHLTRHIRTHTGEKPYKCTVCAASFTDRSTLSRHMRIHTGDKPYKCSVCGVGFTQKSNLKTHMRIHTGEKPHGCSVCEVSFTEKGSLSRHMRIHTGDKPYKCTICGDGFAQAHHFQRHTMKHTGEKPHICSVCGSGFRQKSDLKIHVRIHTSE